VRDEALHVISERATDRTHADAGVARPRQRGVALALALAFTFTFALTLTLTFTFALALAFTFTFTFTFTFALAFAFTFALAFAATFAHIARTLGAGHDSGGDEGDSEDATHPHALRWPTGAHNHLSGGE
jgi:hypothetical protein